MPAFGVLSISGAGHLNPLFSLSRQLTTRGHTVTFFHRPELADHMHSNGMAFVPVGAKASVIQRKQGPAGEFAELRYRLRRTADEMEMFLREAPPAIRGARIDALILDEVALAGPSIAEILGLPYFVISTSVPHRFGWSAPRRITPTLSWTGRLQKHFLEISIHRMRGPVLFHLNRLRRNAGLRPVRQMQPMSTELAHLTQLPQCLDFPRGDLPQNFHYTGPFVDQAARPHVDFPWDRLDGRPIIYASLGTTLRGDVSTFHAITAACDGLDLQLVISLGSRRNSEMFRDLAGAPLVVQKAPQLDLLKRAAAIITHAGSNTVLEALMYGKPMIAIPCAFDQPAMAARLEWLGAAEVLSVSKLAPEEIRAAIIKILNDDRYRNNAMELQKKIIAARGLERAADLIEDALTLRRSL